MKLEFLLWLQTGMGVALLIWSLSMFSRSRKSSRWPTAKGTVTASKMEFDGGNNNMRIEYKYTVGRNEYTSKRIYFGPLGGNLRTAKEPAEKYSIDKEVTVFYNPSKPAYGILEPGRNPVYAYTTLVGTTAIIIVIIIKLLLHYNII